MKTPPEAPNVPAKRPNLTLTGAVVVIIVALASIVFVTTR
jgi:hypothetical protein